MPSRPQRVPTLFGNQPQFDLKTIPGLFLWLRADKGVFMDASNKVALWQDQSGNANDFSNGTSATCPYFNITKSNLNYKPTVQFVNGSSYHLNAATMTNTSTSHTFIFAVSSDSLTAVQDFFATTTGILVIAHVAATTGQIGWYDGSWKQAGGSTSTTGAQIVCYTLNAGGSGTIYKNNTSLYSTGYTSKQIGGAAGLGSSADGTAQYYNGHMAEVAYWPRVLSAAELSTVHAYMGARYGITVA